MPRVSPVRSVLEWCGAAVLLLGVLWMASVLLRDWIAPRVSLLGEAEPGEPVGVPDGATEVPLLVLLDGTEIKVGDAHARIVNVLDERHAIGPLQMTRGDFGERWTRAYQHGSTRFFVVCERTEPDDPFKVARIYLP